MAWNEERKDKNEGMARHPARLPGWQKKKEQNHEGTKKGNKPGWRKI